MSDSPTVRIDRANRAEAALKELDPVFEAIIDTYMRRQREIARSEPWAAQKMSNLAVAANIAEDVRNAIRSMVTDGDIAREELKRSRHIEEMSPERRRYADMLG